MDNQNFAAELLHRFPKGLALSQKLHQGLKVERPGILITNTGIGGDFQPAGLAYLNYQNAAQRVPVSVGYKLRPMIKVMAESVMSKPENILLNKYDVGVHEAKLHVIQERGKLITILGEGNSTRLINGQERVIPFEIQPAYKVELSKAEESVSCTEVNGVRQFFKYAADSGVQMLTCNMLGAQIYRYPVNTRNNTPLTIRNEEFSNVLDMLYFIAGNAFHVGLHNLMREEVLRARIKHLAFTLQKLAILRQETLCDEDINTLVVSKTEVFLKATEKTMVTTKTTFSL